MFLDMHQKYKNKLIVEISKYQEVHSASVDGGNAPSWQETHKSRTGRKQLAVN